ncbi:MAG: phosphomannomutase/phosphoglucomutase [Candidatus Parcubacteria bacterium]|nr:phosphomannomutase/phosphoglucomutase [Candidatus Parcubacteria bacterium]
MALNSNIFKAYDVRGIYPDEINEEAVYQIAQAYLKVFKPKGAIVLGKDVRLSSPSLWQSAAKGITNAGFDVIDIGTISTDMLYFAVAYYGYGGGMVISASHNPKEYNGLKFVREKAIAISEDTGLLDIKKQVFKGEEIIEPEKGDIIVKEIMADYVKHCLSFIEPKVIKPMKIVADANFGMAGVALNKILEFLPVEIVPLNFHPDGNFPKGRPDPMILERRQEIEALVKEEKADLGVAWDGDADRCFIFDENGEYVDNYFLTAIFAKLFLAKSKKKDTPSLKLRSVEKIILDPRQYWAVRDTVTQAGGKSIMSKVGHALIKDCMRKNNVLFAGEITGHFYFRDNFYCDNGMIPLLMVLEMLSQENKKISELVQPYRAKYFISGEINKQVKNPDEVLQNVANKFKDKKIDYLDGIGVEFEDWRFNLRKSNTEPLIRLNVEAKSQTLVDEKVKELMELIK